MDYVLIAVLVFLSSFLGASIAIPLAIPRERKPKSIATNYFSDIADKFTGRDNQSEIITELDNINEWFHGKAGGTKDEE